ncbi:MAG: TetR/AcrR family transcriptional regulator, partial [Pseudomonadota bacterium]
MAKQTFINLNEDKRERLLSAAIDEFGAFTFEQANIDRIAKASSISKGSFYQYFEGKNDLYRTSVSEALNRAWTFFEGEVADRDPQDCFELLEAAILQMYALREQHPSLASIYARVVHDPSSHLQSSLFPQFLDYSNQFNKRFYDWCTKTGDIYSCCSRAMVRLHVKAMCSRWN